jgi:hypothetical protein
VPALDHRLIRLKALPERATAGVVDVEADDVHRDSRCCSWVPQLRGERSAADPSPTVIDTTGDHSEV